MSSTVRYVGLDVHKRVLEACILDAAGKVTARHRFDNLDRQTLAAFARRHLRPTDRVALEASTNTHTVVDLLRPHVAEVVVSNPMQTKAIAWKMLKHHQPYRYALPQTTENKLRQLRIRATGERRRGAVPKGQKSKPLLPGGGRTLRSLDGVYHSEGLPTRSDLPAGERRVIHQTETRAFVDQLSRPRIVPRTTRTNRPSKRTP